MVSRYPDVKLYHIVAVLAMRGDLNKNGCTKVRTSSTNKMQLCFIAHAHGKAPQNYLSINWVLDCVSFYVTKGLSSREAATGHASKNNNFYYIVRHLSPIGLLYSRALM